MCVCVGGWVYLCVGRETGRQQCSQGTMQRMEMKKETEGEEKNEEEHTGENEMWREEVVQMFGKM